MLNTAFTDFIQLLQDPNTSSSLIPLILVLIFFFVGSSLLVYKWIKALRNPKHLGIPEAEVLPKDPPVVLLSPETKIKHFFKQRFKKKEPIKQLEPLQSEIDHSKKENVSLREQHDKALNRINELQEEVKMLGKQHEEDKARLAQIDSREEKLHARVEQLETQLTEIVREVETLHRQNEKVVDQLPPTETKAAPAPELLTELEQQAAEIQRLKGLLLVCREQIVQFTQKHKTQPHS